MVAISLFVWLCHDAACRCQLFRRGCALVIHKRDTTHEKVMSFESSAFTCSLAIMNLFSRGHALVFDKTMSVGVKCLKYIDRE